MSNGTNLFTFLVEFKGGTYIRQIDADSIHSAFDIWKDGELENVAKLSNTLSSLIQDEIGTDLVEIDGCLNVWCLSSSVDGVFFLMNIVATARSQDLEGKAA